VKKPEGNTPIGTLRYRLEDDIKIDFRELIVVWTDMILYKNK
jgi:hypothetical protein